MVDMIEASYEDRLILVQFSFYHWKLCWMQM